MRTGLKFSTDPNPEKSKSNCIFMCGKNTSLSKPVPIRLAGKELPWVVSATHLGHELNESGKQDKDARMKRGNFVVGSVQVRENFHFASPVESLAVIKKKCSTLYGCMLWELGGQAAEQVFNAWNTCVKLTWNIPCRTHTYFIDHLLSGRLTSLRSDVLSQYRGFLLQLQNSPSHKVATIANIVMRDVGT